jgi:hypothetical protein
MANIKHILVFFYRFMRFSILLHFKANFTVGRCALTWAVR